MEEQKPTNSRCTCYELTVNIYALKFISLQESFDLKQHVQSPTHRCGHNLDLVITRTNSGALGISDVCGLEQPYQIIKLFTLI